MDSTAAPGLTDEARELLALAEELARKELRPRADDAERAGEFPRELIRTLGRSGFLGLPYPQEYGGGGQPYGTYLQVLEMLAGSWLTVALSISVHTLACYPTAAFGTDEQRARLLPELLAGERLGAYCLSEAQSGSDAAALSAHAMREADGYQLDGNKAWVTHAGVADFYSVMARTEPHKTHGISCFLVPGDTAGLTAAAPENKMGMRASPTASVHLDGARVAADRLIGAEGDGFPIALSALDSGRLGIAACATGLAQGSLDHAFEYAMTREQFGRPVFAFQGLAFLLADMTTQVEAGRAIYLAAARRRDAGVPYSRQAAMAKLFCTDMAMQVTTDAVQVLGGAGYVEDHPVERYMREAKVMQIFEGTNQIQRVVIARSMAREHAARHHRR
ncbi:MAG: acyl-CoA dehydrogenase family protein [Mycobacteriales bacterium]|nr:MAG: acyl-CoA dehydrogenase [Pseudonocardiales bacterium]